MTIVAVVGDATTTTAVALAVGWPTGDSGAAAIVLEADPTGGSLAGWLDTPSQPSLSAIIANVGPDAGRDRRSTLATVDAMTQQSNAGVRFVANAVRSRAARRAVDEAAAIVVPALAAGESVVIADTGCHRCDVPVPSPLASADVVVVVHRQATASAAAATVRIERLVETVEALAPLPADIVLAVVGGTPFDPSEIFAFVNDSVPGAIRATAALADDPLSAATIAGRAGVSARRLGRLPLTRDASRLASALADLVDARRRHSTALTSDGRPA